VPGFSVADSCGFPPAIAPDVEFATVQLPLLDGPTPSASGLVVAGDTDASVTATLPDVATENVKTSEPFGARAPLKVSVVEVPVEGAVGLPNRSLSGFLQADVIITDAGISSDRKSRRTVILLLSAWARALIRLDGSAGRGNHAAVSSWRPATTPAYPGKSAVPLTPSFARSRSSGAMPRRLVEERGGDGNGDISPGSIEENGGLPTVTLVVTGDSPPSRLQIVIARYGGQPSPAIESEGGGGAGICNHAAPFRKSARTRAFLVKLLMGTTFDVFIGSSRFRLSAPRSTAFVEAFWRRREPVPAATP